MSNTTNIRAAVGTAAVVVALLAGAGTASASPIANSGISDTETSDAPIGSDPEWKYVSVRRYLPYVEHSIQQGNQWAVFESNRADATGGDRYP